MLKVQMSLLKWKDAMFFNHAIMDAAQTRANWRLYR